MRLNSLQVQGECSAVGHAPRRPLLELLSRGPTVYPKKYAHGFVVLCFVVIMQSFIMNSHVFIHIHQGCFAGTGAIVRLPQCQWSKPDDYGKISQCITTTKHNKAKTMCIFLGIYCTWKSCNFYSFEDRIPDLQMSCRGLLIGRIGQHDNSASNDCGVAFHIKWMFRTSTFPHVYDLKFL